MTKLLRSTEFGDWLLVKISETTKMTKSLDPVISGLALVRLQSLQAAKVVLRDFLKLQQKMLAKAMANGH